MKILGKGRKERILPFGHQTKRLLDRYIHHLRPEPLYKDRVFLNSEGYPITENTVKMFVERAAKKANIPRLHIHLLRHTLATRFVMQGGDTMWLQTLMGHERLETTQRYVKRVALQQIVLKRALTTGFREGLGGIQATFLRSIALERLCRFPEQSTN